MGPALFLLYTAELQEIVTIRHALRPHLYADDTQIYGSCRPTDINVLQDRVAACIDKVANWTRVNRLQLNTTKTEVIWFSILIADSFNFLHPVLGSAMTSSLR